jgi:hypothetical protein
VSGPSVRPLELRSDCGAVFLAGDVGPFAPYLPSGAYL